jgi:hypothetical protein
LLGSSSSSSRDAHQLTASGLLAGGFSPNLRQHQQQQQQWR